jgi:redox-sensitive bicupin YhaK (pirin superfamily)
MNRDRSVSSVVQSERTVEGAGFVVHRPFPTRNLDHFDPFLLLDEMGPVELRPGEAQGAPDHPHRGFETVTYLLAGGLKHKDSQGNAGALGPGDVQWMTAGAGVVHSEMPNERMLREGGLMHGFQLWVNLPARDKMMKPRYQEIAGSEIPVAKSDDGQVTVRVIAGEALSVRAVIDTRTPIFYLHFVLAPGARVTQPAPRDYNTFAYVIDGEGRFGDGETAHAGGRGQMVTFANDGEQVTLANPAGAQKPLELLLLGGVPLNEPVARYGPFVMNHEREIMQAIDDFRRGKLGRIDA